MLGGAELVSQHNNPDLDYRRDQRRVTNLATLIDRTEGTSTFARIANLSYEGCELRSPAKLDLGESINLTLPKRGRIRAQVRWATGDRLGAQFFQ
jgi:PilZ domain-containing protein